MNPSRKVIPAAGSVLPEPDPIPGPNISRSCWIIIRTWDTIEVLRVTGLVPIGEVTEGMEVVEGLNMEYEKEPGNHIKIDSTMEREYLRWIILIGHISKNNPAHIPC
jgi:hypothetical protein